MTGARVVDDRTFLLGLDAAYRERMMRHEAHELLECARAVASALSLSLPDVPVEGYYATSPVLTEYFRTVRGLQAQPLARRPEVEDLPEFTRLLAVVSSRIFGFPEDREHLLPQSAGALTTALREVPWEKWGVDALVDAARRIAVEDDDRSLTGLAAFAGDAVVLAATRESVVLYMSMELGAWPWSPRPPFAWHVTPELARRASSWVKAFNALLGESIPVPGPEAAEFYWQASRMNNLMGRCVALGTTRPAPPRQVYHWAIRYGRDAGPEVTDFWADEIWTTERYSAKLHGRRWTPPSAP